MGSRAHVAVLTLGCLVNWLLVGTKAAKCSTFPILQHPQNSRVGGAESQQGA